MDELITDEENSTGTVSTRRRKGVNVTLAREE